MNCIGTPLRNIAIKSVGFLLLAVLCAAIGFAIGKNQINESIVTHRRVDNHEYFPSGEMLVLGNVELLEQIPNTNVMGYKVKVEQFDGHPQSQSLIHVRLRGLTESHSFWHPYKMSLPPPPFKALFVLNKDRGEGYAASWIVPEEAFAWPLAPGLVNFIRDASIR